MLSVRHSREGKAIEIPWTIWHLGIIFAKFPEIRSTGKVVICKPQTFSIDESALWSDGTPGETYTWELIPGDILEAWR